MQFVTWLPSWLLQKQANAKNPGLEAAIKKMSSGTYSNMGRMQGDEYSCDDFKATTIFGIPVPVKGNFFLGTWENEYGLDLVFSTQGTASVEDGLAQIVEAISARGTVAKRP